VQSTWLFERPPSGVRGVAIAVGVLASSALSGCASETPATRLVASIEADAPVRWIGPANVPLIVAADEHGRSFAALDAVLAYWGRSNGAARRLARAPSDAVLAGDLERAARAVGLSTVSFHGALEDVVYELRAGRPVIVAMAPTDAAPAGASHYEVVVAWDPAGHRLRSLDPARGFVERTAADFQDDWRAARGLILVVFESEQAMGTISSSG
jgi:hypothetical protein